MTPHCICQYSLQRSTCGRYDEHGAYHEDETRAAPINAITKGQTVATEKKQDSPERVMVAEDATRVDKHLFAPCENVGKPYV